MPLLQSKIGLILWDVVQEHFDEAEFLFGQWERALHSPKYNLTELGKTLERRLEAHIDGLVVGGPEVAARILHPELANAEEPARAKVAALALLLSEEAETAACVIDTALHAEGPLQQALARALTLASVEPLDGMLLERFRRSKAEPERAALLEILTGRGVDVGNLLRDCIESKDLQLLSAALDAAARFGHQEFAGIAEMHLRSDHPQVRANAMKASLALGSYIAWRLCLQSAQEAEVDDLNLLLLVAILGQPTDHQLLYAQLEDPKRTEWILWALGFCGTEQAGAACLAHLESKNVRVAKAAAEALSWIGGFDLNEQKFQTPTAEPGEDETLPPLEDEDLGAELDLDGVDNLPVPNVEVIIKWWKQNIGKLAQSQRNILGRPHSVAALVNALEVGSMWRRHGVALELDIRTGGAQHVSTDSFSLRQRRQIASLAESKDAQLSWVGA